MFFVPAKIRRRSQRQWVALPVRIVVDGARIDGMSINISEHGLYVFAATTLSIGDEVEIVFRPPEKKKSVLIHGIVRRKAVYLYGIEFLTIDAGERIILQSDNRVARVADSTAT